MNPYLFYFIGKPKSQFLALAPDTEIAENLYSKFRHFGLKLTA